MLRSSSHHLYLTRKELSEWKPVPICEMLNEEYINTRSRNSCPMLQFLYCLLVNLGKVLLILELRLTLMSFLGDKVLLLLQTQFAVSGDFPSRLSSLGNGFLSCPNVTRAVSSGCNTVRTSQGVRSCAPLFLLCHQISARAAGTLRPQQFLIHELGVLSISCWNIF